MVITRVYHMGGYFIFQPIRNGYCDHLIKTYKVATKWLCCGPKFLKMGDHTKSRCQHQPACFSSAFRVALSGIACLVGMGWGLEVPT